MQPNNISKIPCCCGEIMKYQALNTIEFKDVLTISINLGMKFTNRAN